jgi:endonuclease VIII
MPDREPGRMPEGDVVWLAAKRLREALAGRVLTRSDFRVPRFATTDLTGRSVVESVSLGKHLLLRVEGGLTVHTHLRMDGSWRVRAASDRVPASHGIRLILANDTWQAIGYQLGIVEVFRTSQEKQVTGHLGPDLLGPGWDPQEAVRRLRASPGRPAGEALLDQRNLAGVGNFFLTEMLFLRGVSPWRSVGEVEDLDALVELGRRLLDANKTRIDQVTTGDRTPGRRTWVYGRAGQLCRRCGTRIRRAEQGATGEERVRFWCPACQR